MILRSLENHQIAPAALSTAAALAAVVQQQLLLQQLQRLYTVALLSLYCLVIWCIIRIHLWTNKYVNILIDWCCCFQCCCSCHTYCCCCSSWNFLVTLGLWWPCTLCNNTFNYHLQISQNNLSAIFVYEMCKLIYGYSSLTLLWLDGPANCQKATVTASPFDISEIFRLFHFYFQ